MMTTDDVTRDLMNYFAAINAAAGRSFSIRDFHTQVMMNAYAPQDRACLERALAALSKSGVVEPTSRTDWQLTAKGSADARAMRRTRP